MALRNPATCSLCASSSLSMLAMGRVVGTKASCACFTPAEFTAGHSWPQSGLELPVSVTMISVKG